MSVQDAENFIEKIKQNPGPIQKAVEEGHKTIMQSGADHGFHFTEGEWHQGMENHKHKHPEDGDDTCIFC